MGHGDMGFSDFCFRGLGTGSSGVWCPGERIVEWSRFFGGRSSVDSLDIGIRVLQSV